MNNFGRPISEASLNNRESTLLPHSGELKRMSMRVGKITSVNIDKNTVNLEWLWPIAGGINDISLSRPYVGLRSGIHFMPEVGSIVVLGYAFNIPVLLSYLLPTDYENMLNGTPDSSGVASHIDKINPGEILIRSIQKSEIYIHDKIQIIDGKLDSITLDPNTGTVSIDSLNTDIVNEAGEIFMGMVTRESNGISQVITSDGQPLVTSGGGNALTELTINIDSVAGSTINDGANNTNLASITIGTLVDDNGQKVVNQLGNQIVCNMEFASGAIVQIDSSGKFNMMEANMKTPTSLPFINTDPLSTQDSPTFTSPITQQRAARQGDRVVIPMTTPTTSAKDHPELVTKASFNLIQLQQIASMIMTPFGPCIGFTPSIPDTRLVGEITTGSDSVFIGSLNKVAEQQETSNNSL